MDSRPANLAGLDHVVLTGFMGSGKTTVGRLLAERLRWSFADLDAVIAGERRLSVPEIFALHGETAFRKLEVSALHDLLLQPRNVVSLGGGAPETPAVRHLLASAEHTAVVHLHAPFEVLYQRCLSQAEVPGSVSRPLLRSRADAGERYNRRMALYSQVAQHRTDVTRRSPPEIVEDILSILCAEVARP